MYYNYYNPYYNPYELQHYGIKGMKWGVRRFQKKDGTLTLAGKKRYSDFDGKTVKQSRTDVLYNKYKKIGYTDEEAKKMAKGQANTEKALMIAGGVAVAAAVAYGAYKYYDVYADRKIAPGQLMQTVHHGDVSDRISPGNPFYASYTKRDNTIYASKVFSHFSSDSKVTRMYTTDGIKIASEGTGRKIFDEMVKNDPEMAEYSRAIGYFGKGRKAYERFNYSLVIRNDSDTTIAKSFSGLDHDRIHKKFYDELKKRGYGAVIDVNDSRTEGFTFNPIIVFDDQIKHVVATTKADSSQLYGKNFAKGYAYATARTMLAHPISSTPLVAMGANYISSIGMAIDKNKELDRKIEFVNQYMAEHPDTTLTVSKIEKMYEKSLRK